MKILNMIKLKLILVLNLISLSSFPQEGNSLEKIKNTKVIKVCTAGGFIPFSVNTKEGWVGFDIDMVKGYAEYLNAKLEVIDYHFDGIIPALNTKKCDLIASGMTITADRKKSVLFSEPYFKDGLSYLYRKNNVKFEKIKDISMLNDEQYKIGVRVGYTSDFYVTKNLSKAKILKFNETADIINALRNNKIDAIVTDTNNTKILQKKFADIFEYKNTNVQNEYFGVAVRLKDDELLHSFNEYLNYWKKSGQYEKDYEKNFISLTKNK
jgi:polar amino acid transport system substrate-binding protein